jgi:hypothetical protein
MSRIMTNFRAEDMPGRPKKTVAKKPVVKKVEPKPVVVEPVVEPVVAEEVKPAKPEAKRTGGGGAKPMVAE